jgi:YD repeat-containing protein
MKKSSIRSGVDSSSGNRPEPDPRVTSVRHWDLARRERVTSVTDHIGRQIIYTHDGSGRLWTLTDPLRGVTEFSYDTAHRMLTITNARGITFLGDRPARPGDDFHLRRRRQLRTATDALTQTTAFDYEVADLVVITDRWGG